MGGFPNSPFPSPGFDYDGSAHLYQTDPSGTFHEWKANAIGRNGKTVREFLEKHYTDEIAASDEACIKLTVRALLEVVQSGGIIFVLTSEPTILLISRFSNDSDLVWLKPI